MRSIRRTVGWGALAASIMVSAAASAATTCGDMAGDSAQAAAVKASLDESCPCTVGTSNDRGDYLRCANRVIGDAVKGGLLRPACRAALRDRVVRSICGRAEGATICCSERAIGEPSCRIAKGPDSCVSTSTRIAWVEPGQSCADSCGNGCGTAADCDDGNSCTADACDAVLGCSHQSIPGCVTTPPPEDPGPYDCKGTAASTWEMSSEELKLLDLVNAERRRSGAVALKPCRSLAKAAQMHSADMRDRDYFSHTSRDGRTYVDRMCDAGYTCEGTWHGEVLTSDPYLAPGAFEDWMNSPSHKAVLLHRELRVAGVGYACGGRYFGYWTVDLGGVDDASCR